MLRILSFIRGVSFIPLYTVTTCTCSWLNYFSYIGTYNVHVHVQGCRCKFNPPPPPPPPSEVYPYFVIILGLENILIIVKAVMSTSEDMEVGILCMCV